MASIQTLVIDSGSCLVPNNHLGGQYVRNVFGGYHRHIQCRGSRPGVQISARFCITRRERLPRRRPVHRRRPAHMQSLVQLLEVHRRTVQRTECFSRVEDQDNRFTTQRFTAAWHGFRIRATTMRWAEPTTTSWPAESDGGSIFILTARCPTLTPL